MLSLWKENNEAIFTVEIISDKDDFFNHLCEGGVSEGMAEFQSLEYSPLYLSLKQI